MAVTRAKRHRPSSLGYNNIICIPFPAVSIVPNMSRGITYCAIPLFLNVKIIGVSMYLSVATTGNMAFNIAQGAGLLAAPAIPNIDNGQYPVQLAQNGSTLFQSDQTVTTNFTGVQYWDTTTPAQGGVSSPAQTVATYDAIWPQGKRLTLRLTTDSGPTGTTLYVYVWAQIVDLNPQNPGGHAMPFYPSANML